MWVSPTLAARIVVATLAMMSLAANAEDRSQLNACQALISAEDAKPAAARRNDPEIQRCRQIMREWTFRDQRMSVDEQGRPLR
jgi:hypothetical protein